MDTIKIALLMVLALLIFGGCEEKSKEETQSVTSMQQDILYIVYPGDTIKRTGGNLEINVTHTLSDDIKYVELISGSGDLIRSD